MNPAALALSSTDALGSYPTLLGETLSSLSTTLDAHPLGCLCLGLLIGHNEVLFWQGIRTFY